MPVVPMPTRQPSSKPTAPAQPMPPEPFQLMAAAQMHSDGRLIQPVNMDDSQFRRSDNIEDRRAQMNYGTLSRQREEDEQNARETFARNNAKKTDDLIQREGSPFPLPLDEH